MGLNACGELYHRLLLVGAPEEDRNGLPIAVGVGVTIGIAFDAGFTPIPSAILRQAQDRDGQALAFPCQGFIGVGIESDRARGCEVTPIPAFPHQGGRGFASSLTLSLRERGL